VRPGRRAEVMAAQRFLMVLSSSWEVSGPHMLYSATCGDPWMAVLLGSGSPMVHPGLHVWILVLPRQLGELCCCWAAQQPMSGPLAMCGAQMTAVAIGDSFNHVLPICLVLSASHTPRSREPRQAETACMSPNL